MDQNINITCGNGHGGESVGLHGSELKRSIEVSSENLNKENSVVFCLFFQILHAVIPSIHTCLDWSV